MLRKRSPLVIIATATVTFIVGLAGAGVAHAAGTLTVQPSTGLSDGDPVTVQINGFTATPLASLQLAVCGNAYADGTALASTPSTMPGVLDSVDCSVVRFVSPGQITSAPFTMSNVMIHQTGIGTGNRSCISAPPALAPCLVYVSTSINLPPFPQAPVTFAGPPTSAPAPTSTTVMPIGSPISTGKVAHALVQVTASDPLLRPEGHVTVFENGNPLGGGVLGANATVNVALGVPSLGPHVLSATYAGNGSFQGSVSPNSTLSVILAKNISIGDASVVEGDSGARIVSFATVLSQASSAGVSVDYTIVGTGAHPATIGTDVVAASGTLVFRPVKQTVKYLSVKVIGDRIGEPDDKPDETFAVQLSSPTAGYVLRRPVGTGTIIDDDASPSSTVKASIGDNSVPEGDVGTMPVLKLTVSLSKPNGTATAVTVQVSNGSATRGKKRSGDFGGAVKRTVNIPAGSVSKTLNIPVYGDTTDELDETMVGTILSASAGVAIGPRSVATGTILTDE